MKLAELNAELDMKDRHDVQRTASLMLAIDCMTECWNGCYDTDEFVNALRRTAERLTTLADNVAGPAPRREVWPDYKPNPPHTPT